MYVLKRHIKIKNAMNAIGRHVEYIYEPFKNDRQYASVSKVQELALAALNEQFKKILIKTMSLRSFKFKKIVLK